MQAEHKATYEAARRAVAQATSAADLLSALEQAEHILPPSSEEVKDARGRLSRALIDNIIAAEDGDEPTIRSAVDAADHALVLCGSPEELLRTANRGRSWLAEMAAEAERRRERVDCGLPADLEMPSELLCPISLEPIKDPVVADDGFTYERTNIQRWIDESKVGIVEEEEEVIFTYRSPKTNELILDLSLRPNLAIKSMLTSWSEEQHKRLLKSVATYEAKRQRTADAH